MAATLFNPVRPPLGIYFETSASLKWSKSGIDQNVEISKRRERAERISSCSEFGSPDYYDSLIEEALTYSAENDLILRVSQRLPEGSKEFENVRSRHKANQETIGNKVSSLIREEEQFIHLLKLSYAASSGNLVTLRATVSARSTAQSSKVINSFSVWDIVLGRLSTSGEVKACHIFPLSLGQKSMDYIFGEDAKDSINTAENGLLLPHRVLEAFDEHQLAIVPDGPHSTPQNYKFLILDSSLWDVMVYNDITFKDLHGGKLQFQPEGMGDELLEADKGNLLGHAYGDEIAVDEISRVEISMDRISVIDSDDEDDWRIEDAMQVWGNP
ncbi:hypothetical protein AJ79_04911 [Helicocarpus griseus UAMH5409]|uniref:HNH nuclease domain-containing protein n=1 Tax=Helicocarpus griseus UAMH5409 TaxID=1447875 RepID=A0A2B7XR14_9EURO|nr:hypothetical protein AJ79_04911 [Helicocarpus griseus UAMH5409]